MTRFRQPRAGCALVWVLAGLGLPGTAMACRAVSGTDAYSGGTIKVSNEVVADKVLAGWLGNTYGGPKFTGCPRETTLPARFTPTTSGLTFVRTVKVNGIDYRAYGWSSTSPLVIFQHWQNSAASTGTAPVDARAVTDFSVRTGAASSGSNENLTATIKFALISRGGPMTGVSSSTYRGTTGLRSYPGIGTTSHSVTFGITVPALPCTLSDASLTLPDVRTGELAAVGRTAGDRPLAVTMNCPASGTPVKLTLTDANGSTGAAGQLTPTAGSTAAGVRIRLLRGSTPVALGTQWNHGSSSAGNQQIPFTAQYIRTGTLGAGNIGGEATLTADYR